MALSTTGWASPPGMRNVPKPRRGIATPCVVIDSMMVSSMRQVVIVLGGCLGPARLDEFGDDAVERRRTFDRGPAVVAELDPALVEAVKHPDPRQRILRALRTEDLLPALARHRLDPDRALQDRGEGAGQIVGRDAGSPLQLDDSHSDPILPEKRGGQAPDILRRDHREQLVSRLPEAAQPARPP